MPFFMLNQCVFPNARPGAGCLVHSARCQHARARVSAPKNAQYAVAGIERQRVPLVRQQLDDNARQTSRAGTALGTHVPDHNTIVGWRVHLRDDGTTGKPHTLLEWLGAHPDVPAGWMEIPFQRFRPQSQLQCAGVPLEKKPSKRLSRITRVQLFRQLAHEQRIEAKCV
jgi:hypothetical protein